VFGIGPHHHDGHSTENSVNGGKHYGGRNESAGIPRTTSKLTTIKG